MASSPILSAVLTLFNEQEKSVIEALGTTERRVKKAITIENLFSLGYWIERAKRLFRSPIFGTIEKGFEYGVNEMSVKLDFDPTNAEVGRVLTAVLDKTNEINVTTRNQLADVISSGLDAGKNTNEIATDIQSAFTQMRATRAAVIAQTAGTAAFESGRVEAFRLAGITIKRWLTQRDGKVRTTHKKLDGEERAVNETFSNGLRYPADPNGKPSEIIRCRCTILPIKNDK